MGKIIFCWTYWLDNSELKYMVNINSIDKYLYVLYDHIRIIEPNEVGTVF